MSTNKLRLIVGFGLLSLIVQVLLAQGINTKSCYELEDFHICPEEKVIRSASAVGGSDVDDDGNVYHWDGVSYMADPKIDYENTSMYIIGNVIAFQEYVGSFNLSSFNIFNSSFDRYDNVLYSSGGKLYSGVYDKRIVGNISKKTEVRAYIYQDKSNHIYVIRKDMGDLAQLEKLPNSFDLDSFHYLSGSYFYDKNNLYTLAPYTLGADDEEKITSLSIVDSSNGAGHIPIEYPYYIVYGDNVYSKKKYVSTKKMDLVADRIKTFELGMGSDGIFLSDGYRLYNLEGREIQKDYLINGAKNNWQAIGYFYSSWIVDKKNKTLQFIKDREKIRYPKQELRGAVYKEEDTYFIIDGNQNLVGEYDKLLFYNVTTRQYEDFDITAYRHIVDDFYVYKGVLYGHDNCPVYGGEVFDLDKLNVWHFLNYTTHFLSDGKHLIYYGNMTGINLLPDKDDKTFYYHDLGRRICLNVNMKELKGVRENVLVTKKYLYSASSSGIETIPLQDLGLRVVLCTQDY